MRWVVDEDWTHAGFVAVCGVLVLALVALYRREKEDDDIELKGLQASIDTFRARILPSYPFSQAHVFQDVLEIRLRLAFQNNAESNISPRVSKVRLFHKPGSLWLELPPVTLGTCSAYVLEVYRVPSRSLEYGSFDVRACLPGGASTYADRPLRVEIEIAVPGQRLKRLARVFRLDPVTPPAGPEPSRASEPDPPS